MIRKLGIYQGDPQNSYSERVTIAERQGASENRNCEDTSTQIKTNFRIMMCIQHGKEKKLSEVVNTETLCADPETELSDILAVFSTEKVKAVPIVNQKEKVVGILTQNDLIQTMIKITHLLEF